MLNLPKIRHIRHVLTIDACWTLLFGQMTSHLDYANGLFIGLPTCDIAKFQHVQITAAKVILNQTKYDSATKIRKELHRLPVRFRIIYKTLTLVYKSLKGNAPKYLQDLLHEYQPGRDDLQSGNVPGITLKASGTRCKTFADRSFSMVGPKLWNNLPHPIRTIENLDSFEAKPKTHLFNKAFN